MVQSFVSSMHVIVSSRFAIQFGHPNNKEQFLDLASERYHIRFFVKMTHISQHCAWFRTQEMVILQPVGPHEHAEAKKWEGGENHGS